MVKWAGEEIKHAYLLHYHHKAESPILALTKAFYLLQFQAIQAITDTKTTKNKNKLLTTEMRVLRGVLNVILRDRTRNDVIGQRCRV